MRGFVHCDITPFGLSVPAARPAAFYKLGSEIRGDALEAAGVFQPRLSKPLFPSRAIRR